jgi:hypothetical protein
MAMDFMIDLLANMRSYVFMLRGIYLYLLYYRFISCLRVETGGGLWVKVSRRSLSDGLPEWVNAR